VLTVRDPELHDVPGAMGRVRLRAGVAVEEGIQPWRAIEGAAVSLEADVIVSGTHGHGPFGRAFLGRDGPRAPRRGADAGRPGVRLRRRRRQAAAATGARSGTTVTGHGASCSSPCAVLPTTERSRAYPCVPTTI
jgi:hypothetical protein